VTASISTPMNFIGNAFLNLMHDPAAEQAAPLVAGVAMDVGKNAPIDLYSNIPHFETEVNANESGNIPGSSTGS
jgi:hypothetical protein